MFERLIDILVEFVELFQCFIYVDHYDQAVILRAGKYNRTVSPGIRFILPFGIEDAIDINIKPEPQYLDTQTLTTSDGYIVHIQVGYSLRVTDPKTFLLEYEDTDDLIGMAISDMVAKKVLKSPYAKLQDGTWKRGLLSAATKKAHTMGAAIDELFVQDLASGEANRLWVEGIEL